MNDENEIIELACTRCGNKKRGTYHNLFGDLPSLAVLPKMICKCGGDITIELTGQYDG